jgi:hypothetical protein
MGRNLWSKRPFVQPPYHRCADERTPRYWPPRRLGVRKVARAPGCPAPDLPSFSFRAWVGDLALVCDSEQEGEMSKGKEFVRRLHQVLTDFEQAVVKREHKKLLDDPIVLQQDVDAARQRVVDTMVELVRAAQEEYLPKK